MDPSCVAPLALCLVYMTPGVLITFSYNYLIISDSLFKGILMGPNGIVFVIDVYIHRIYYFR